MFDFFSPVYDLNNVCIDILGKEINIMPNSRDTILSDQLAEGELNNRVIKTMFHVIG